LAIMSDHEDVLESAEPSRRRGGTTAIVAIVIAFAVGLGVGYQLRGRPVAQPRPQPSPAAASPDPLGATGERCSAQDGRRLQLGVELVNPGGSVVLQEVRVELPLGGLKQLTTTWGACGQLSAPSAAGELRVADGATAWVSATFEVLDPCPAPYPVRFTVAYLDAGGVARQTIAGGFADLGDVPYSGCPTPN